MKKIKKNDNIKCPKCDYCNTKKNYEFYGTCTRCGYVLNERNKFKHEMNMRLRLWRGVFK